MLAYIPYPSWIHSQIVPFLPIRWYGVMYIVAFAITYFLFMHQMKSRGTEPNRDLVLDMFFWGIVGLLVGARLFAVTIYDPEGYYLRNPLQIILPFSITNGKFTLTGIAGMSYHGGLLGTVIALVTFMKVKKIDVLDWSDMIVAGIPLGYTFGRLGNFINGELYGRVTRVSWGMLFPGAEKFPAGDSWVKDFASSIGLPLTTSDLVDLPRHPSQLYEAFFEGLVLWLILWFIVRKRKPYKGFVLACYIMGYGIFRFLIEYTRQPDKGLGPGGLGYPIMLAPNINPLYQVSPFNFTTGQILNFMMIALAVVLMFVFSSMAKRMPPQPDAPRPTGRKLRKKLQKGS
jgi:phosphatidylglycerol:prolipoprotein diacylglycerol transferase